MSRRTLELVSPTTVQNGLDRARQVLQRDGPHQLGDHELLALCLGPRRAADAVVWAAKVLETVGGPGPLSRLRCAGIAARTELNESQAARLVAAFELGRRAQLDSERALPRRPLCQSQVEAWAMPRLGGLAHEEVWVLCVNATSRLQSTFLVGRGGIHGCGLLARDILTPIVRDGASGFVLVHNHPSGDPTPSPEDIDLTKNLQLAASHLGIPLLDHVIVARHGARSLFQLGHLQQ